MKKTKLLIYLMLPALTVSNYTNASAVGFDGSLNYSQDFSGLGTANVTWNDGTTVTGWYMIAAETGFTGDTNNNGIPDTVFGRDISTLGSTGAAYHIGDSSNRALSWVRTSATGLVYIGNQFRNDGATGVFDVNVTYNMEQWRAVQDSASTVTLQYRVTSTGGNILTTSGWTTLGPTASLPNTSTTGNVDGLLPANQFTLGGTIAGLEIGADQFLSFRIVGNIPNGAAFGVGSTNMTVIPEPGTYGIILAGLLGLFAVAYRQRS